jgi:hypothetical protein
MRQTNTKKAQAAIELAVFGAILIFLVGSIVRSAMGNSYQQNKTFKVMRMAMLASWNDSKNYMTAHNEASILVVEDRLSPDVNKYGSLERTPYMANGSGTFSAQLMYPLGPGQEVISNLPLMDVYINGQHFPFTTSAYIQNQQIQPPVSPCSQPDLGTCNTQCLSKCNTNIMGPPAPALPGSLSPQQWCTDSCQTQCKIQQCKLDQCLRNHREWVDKQVGLHQFDAIVPVLRNCPSVAGILGLPINVACVEEPLLEKDGGFIIGELSTLKLINNNNPAGIYQVTVPTDGNLLLTPNGGGGFTFDSGSPNYQNIWQQQFVPWYSSKFKYKPIVFQDGTQVKNRDIHSQLIEIKNILFNDQFGYKLFYTVVPNGTKSAPLFEVSPPAASWPGGCTGHPCKDRELSGDQTMKDSNGNIYNNGGGQINLPGEQGSGDMEYDLLRNGDYAAVENALPLCPGITGLPQCGVNDAATCMRCDIAWQWAATAAIPGSNGVYIDTSNGQYPSYDTNGSLKEQTIYAISQDSLGNVTVSYMDPAQADVDPTWDINTCGPKPGLQNGAVIYTLTQDGTYLQILEGKLYNPETGQVVRSVNKKDSVDVIERTFQLSNNTGHFCNGTTPIVNSAATPIYGLAPNEPNPVEACVGLGSTGDCYTGTTNIGGKNVQNMKLTCFDTTSNMLFIRSRLQDLRGRFWITNASGQLGFH